jgi:transposase
LVKKYGDNFYQGERIMRVRIEFNEGCPDFLKLSKKERDPRMRVRLIAMSHLKNGKTMGETAKMVGIERHSIGMWYTKFKNFGLCGLEDLPKTGRPPKLARENENEFIQKISDLQCSRNGGRVTGYDIQRMACNDFDADYADDSIYTVLKRLDVSWITARSKHPKADSEAQAAFKKTSNKKLQKACQ